VLERTAESAQTAVVAAEAEIVRLNEELDAAHRTAMVRRAARLPDYLPF
jgi:hypothetical protein